jgi:hypothetical protein
MNALALFVLLINVRLALGGFTIKEFKIKSDGHVTHFDVYLDKPVSI